MDSKVIEQLRVAGVDVAPRRTLVHVAVRVEAEDRIAPLGEEVPILVGDDQVVLLPLKPVSALFTGVRRPPVFTNGPDLDYVMFFASIERPVADCANLMASPPTDQDFERLYRKLKRHPDATDPSPVFSYMQAGARAYMSLTDVSRAEFEAVVARLAQSARTFSIGLSSRNYFGQLARMFLTAEV